jgi:hypothetical protein
MSPCRITKLEIQGFRAFGRNGQTLDLPSLLAAVWGPNSQGKTSLAEAVEFLLTGQIVRRALMASSQDEFADALRNAHLPIDTQVFVQAIIVDTNGAPRTVRRTLKTDYGKKQECETILQIDGKVAAEADLARLGIILSQPPLRAPVLAQHTLGYVFSVRPQDRASYFKALLEVTDLEDFRQEVAAIEQDIAAPAHPLIGKLELAAAIAGAGRHLNPLLTESPSSADLKAALDACCKDLIEAQSEAAPTGHEEKFAGLGAILAEKRSKTFALKGFDRKPLPAWSGQPASHHDKLARYIDERGKVDEETRRLTGLFREALALPTVAAGEEALDCPLCARKPRSRPRALPLSAAGSRTPKRSRRHSRKPATRSRRCRRSSGQRQTALRSPCRSLSPIPPAFGGRGDFALNVSALCLATRRNIKSRHGSCRCGGSVALARQPSRPRRSCRR